MPNRNAWIDGDPQWREPLEEDVANWATGDTITLWVTRATFTAIAFLIVFNVARFIVDRWLS